MARREIVYCRSRSTAKRRCSWAAAIAKMAGGFICFEDAVDYFHWKNQK